jgi:hypothetical protein
MPTVDTLRTITSATMVSLLTRPLDQRVQHVGLGQDAGQLALIEHRHLRDAAILEQRRGLADLGVDGDADDLALAERADHVADRARPPSRP